MTPIAAFGRRVDLATRRALVYCLFAARIAFGRGRGEPAPDLRSPNDVIVSARVAADDGQGEHGNGVFNEFG